MAESEAAEIVGRNEESLESRRPIIPFLSLIPKFQFRSPANAPEKQRHRQTEKEAISDDKDGESTSSDKPDVVSFPVSQKPREIPPLKLECHEAEQGSNPVVLWQVYALGGFMILRWVWAKWQERKAKNKKDSGPSRIEDSGEEPPPIPPHD